MMRIADCDDNTEFLNRAVDMVKKWSDLNGTPVEIYSFDNGDSLLAKNASVRMDVVFWILLCRCKREWTPQGS